RQNADKLIIPCFTKTQDYLIYILWLGFIAEVDAGKQGHISIAIAACSYISGPSTEEQARMACTVGAKPYCFCSDYYFYYFFFLFFLFFLTLLDFLGALTYSKTLENWHRRQSRSSSQKSKGWNTGVAQGLCSAPCKAKKTLMHRSGKNVRTCTRLGTLIDLIDPNNFRTLTFKLRPTGSRLFWIV
ncbi:MAG: hypothetical protein ACRCVV_17710, partial [Shewanella sp.]